MARSMQAGALAATLAAGAAGAAPAAAQRARNARVTDEVEVCGGPAPGACWPQRYGSVSVLDGNHHLVARQRLTSASRFSFELRPGDYTLVLRYKKLRWERAVKAVAHHTRVANIVIPIP